jgi:HAD superfamily phosphoserine phosphatase-like hydrolase
MNRAAFFDVDGTLISRPSLEVRFTGYLLQKKVLKPPALTRALRQAVCHAVRQGVRFRNCPRFWLQELPLKCIEELAARFFREIIQGSLFDEMVELFNQHRHQGYRTALLSGAPEFLLQPLGNYLQADAVAGTRLLTDAWGNVVPQIHQPRPHGPGKIHHLLFLRDKLLIDLQQSVGFANEGSDAYHLALLGRPVAVNPDAYLRRIARCLGWPTVNYRINGTRQPS